MRSQREPLTLACFLRLHGYSPSILSCSISSFLVFSSPSIPRLSLHVVFAIVSITTTSVDTSLTAVCRYHFSHNTYYSCPQGWFRLPRITLYLRHRQLRDCGRRPDFFTSRDILRTRRKVCDCRVQSYCYGCLPVEVLTLGVLSSILLQETRHGHATRWALCTNQRGLGSRRCSCPATENTGSAQRDYVAANWYG